jgi:hypothetical protein
VLFPPSVFTSPVLVTHCLVETLPSHFDCYNNPVQRKVFWMTFTIAGLIADFALPFWWALLATIPIGMACWWIAYRSDWF